MVDKNTEDTILEAAKKVFTNKGMTGARMQEIADEAKINKALLHYYFRSKEKLFEAVFNLAFNSFIPKLDIFFDENYDVFERIEKICESYISFLMRNPFIPIFILNELNRNPKKLAKNLLEKINKIPALVAGIESEITKGTIRKIPPEHLLVNILSLTVFPFVAKPLITTVFFSEDTKAYKNFIEERKTQVASFIIHSIKP